MAVQIILKNSSVEDKRPSASQLTNGEISLNYSSAGAFLCCTDTNGDVQQVGGVKIDETAPDAPVKQTLWFKPSTLTLSVFDGDKWLPIAGGGGGGGGGGDIIQIIGNDGIDADTVAGIVTLDVELAGGDDGLEFKSSKLSATLASATDLGSVKVGDNIDVTAGKISVPKATSSTFGVVKLGDGIEIDGDGSISIDVPTTTTYRGSCDLNTPPTGQINPDPALKGDAYINSADATTVDAGWTGITGSAQIGDLVIFDGTIWDLIPLGAGTAPVTSVNGKTGDVVLDYTDVGAASEAQGELADTALQPGDNISELNNDEGYITAAEAPVLSVNGKTGVVVLDAADVGALAPGDNVSELDNDAGYITLAELPDQEPPVIISATAPTGDDAVEGNLWFNSNDGRTYVYYKDGDSSQWVDASPDSGGAGGTVGDYWLEAGGYLSPKTSTNGVDIGGSKLLLNTDGSIIADSFIRAGENSADGAEVGSAISHNGTFQSCVATGNNTGFRIYTKGNSTETTKLLGDGSASFVNGIAQVNSEGNIALSVDGTGWDGTKNSGATLISRYGVIAINNQDNASPGSYVFSAQQHDGAGNVTLTSAITVDGSSQFASDIQSTSQNGGQLAGFRSQLINSDFRIIQRLSGYNATQTVTLNSTEYFADRWAYHSANTGTCRVNTSLAFPNYTMRQGANVSGLRQPIELPATGACGPFVIGSTWTISVWCNTDLTSADFSGPGLIFSDGPAVTSNSMVAANYVDWTSTGETINGFTRYYSTQTIGQAPNATNVCIECVLQKKNDAVNLAFDWAHAQLEPGPVATPFENRPIQTELALCQRYFQKMKVAHSGTVSNTTSYSQGWYYAYPTPMRTTPTTSSTNAGTGYTPIGAVSEVRGGNAEQLRVMLEGGQTDAGFCRFGWAVDSDAEL